MEKQRVTFDGVDEDMELTMEQQEELMQFETVQTKQNDAGTVEFDQVNIADLG